MAMPAGKKRRGDHCKQLDRLGIPVNTGVGVKEISAAGVVLLLEGGTQHTLKADTVIVVGQPEADVSLLERLQALAPDVHAIGDSTGFGLSKKSVAEAMEIAYRI
jgi:2,4-dienoyl-CoA reductase (NADPH2)